MTKRSAAVGRAIRATWRYPMPLAAGSSHRLKLMPRNGSVLVIAVVSRGQPFRQIPWPLVACWQPCWRVSNYVQILVPWFKSWNLWSRISIFAKSSVQWYELLCWCILGSRGCVGWTVKQRHERLFVNFVFRFLLDDAALYLSDKVLVERVDVKKGKKCKLTWMSRYLYNSWLDLAMPF